MSTKTALDAPKRKFAIRSSTKIAIGFGLLAAAFYFGRNMWAAYNVDHLNFPELQPTGVNLVAVNPGAGYRIIVANQIAQLVEGAAGEFDAPTDSGTHGDDSDSGDTAPKRIPIREMLQSLQGNEDALSHFVSSINDLGESRLPPTRIIWTSEDIQKALDGDQEMAKKLEDDLNVTFDGEPLEHLSKSAVLDGIVISCPVQVQVPVGSEVKTLTAHVLEPYKSVLMRSVEKRLENKFDVTDSMMAGYYRDEVQKLIAQPKQKENVRQSLLDQISPKRLQRYAAAPERILRNAKILVNDNLIEGASYSKVETPDGKALYNLDIRLSNDGRLRLWQYSRLKPNFQLLLIVDGIAIAAPRINGELARDEVTITQLPDEGLVQDAVDRMNQKSGQGVKN